MPKAKPDRLFFFLILGISLFGFFIFSSASLGLLSRDGATFNTVAVKQFLVLLCGLAVFLIVSAIDYRVWRKYSLAIFIASVIVTLLIFIPQIGVYSGGARRWIRIWHWTIQPSEFLKLGYVLFLGAWLANAKRDLHSFKKGLLPFVGILAIIGALMVAQPDIDTLVIMYAAGIGMYFVSGARWRHIFALSIIALIAIIAIGLYKPYIIARVKTFINPEQNVQGASYQINQSLIAIGSGGLTGRGFGQSIQKFKYLPEPIGDSIFSVASEEFGFLGGTLLLTMFLLLALSGLRISARAPNQFGRLVTVGIVIMIMTGTFINIASMLGVIPLTGTPLLFVSHGGTALLFALIEAGIIVNISRHQRRS